LTNKSRDMSKDDLDSMIAKERELKDLLFQKQAELAEKRRVLAPHQSEKVLFEIEDFARHFVSGGVVFEDFESIRKNLKLLSELDPKAISKLADDKLYSRGATIKYIIEQLLVSVLNPKSDLWTVLKKIDDTAKVEGNPFFLTLNKRR